MRSLYAPGAAALGLVGAALTALAAPSDSLVPVPNASVDRSSIELEGAVGSTLKASFAVRNHANCSVDLSKARTLLVGITLDCPRWRLATNDSMTCEIAATRSSEADLKDRLLLTARVANDCKPRPLAVVDEREQ